MMGLFIGENLKANEELTVDYNWQELAVLNVVRFIPCCCKASLCDLILQKNFALRLKKVIACLECRSVPKQQNRKKVTETEFSKRLAILGTYLILF